MVGEAVIDKLAFYRELERKQRKAQRLGSSIQFKKYLYYMTFTILQSEETRMFSNRNSRHEVNKLYELNNQVETI